jgi:hypothetical protein
MSINAGCVSGFPDADVHWKGGNFSTVNNFIRALELKVKPSGVAWAPYRAEEE